MLTIDDAHYSDFYISNDVFVFKPQLQKFWKRLRKNFPFLEFRYFVSAELGKQTNRLHFHPIIFIDVKENAPVSFLDVLTSSKTYYNKSAKQNLPIIYQYFEDIIGKTWAQGFASLSPLRSIAGCVYATKYIFKAFDIPLLSFNPVTNTFSNNLHLQSLGIGNQALPNILRSFSDVKIVPFRYKLSSNLQSNLHDIQPYISHWVQDVSKKYDLPIWRLIQPFIYEYYNYSRPLQISFPDVSKSYPLPRYFKNKVKDYILENTGFDKDTFNRSQRNLMVLNSIQHVTSKLDEENCPYLIFKDSHDNLIFKVFSEPLSNYNSDLETYQQDVKFINPVYNEN
ncbi:MAG: hypothetical protein KIG53_04505 [Oscillospiraceae bacterium]|nr:hypothetical protein [Oscillospiraceae bacterium]